MPIFETFERGLLWQFGYGDGLFEELCFLKGMKNDFGKIPKMPRHNDVDQNDVELFADIILKLPSQEEVIGSDYSELESA